MSDGPKPPLPRPGLVQKPGGDDRPKTPPPPPPQALKAGLPKPPDTSSLPSFFKRDVLPPVPITPPQPKFPISKPPQNPITEGKSPAGGVPVSIPATTPAPEPSGAKRLPTPAEGNQQISDSSGDKRLPTSTGGSVQPKKPSRDDITSMLKRTGANPVAAPIGSKPPFNGEAPLAEPPLAKAEPQAAEVSSASAPRTERPSEIPVDIEVDIEVDVGEFYAPLPAPLAQAPPAPAILSFGEIDPHAKTALGIAFNLVSYGNEKPVGSKNGKIFIEGKECGDLYSTKSSGETLRLSLEKLGVTNAHLIKNGALRSKISSFFNTLDDNFFVRACEKNDYAAIVANVSGVRLSFYKAGSDSPSNSFPLKVSREEEKK